VLALASHSAQAFAPLSATFQHNEWAKLPSYAYSWTSITLAKTSSSKHQIFISEDSPLTPIFLSNGLFQYQCALLSVQNLRGGKRGHGPIFEVVYVKLGELCVA